MENRSKDEVHNDPSTIQPIAVNEGECGKKPTTSSEKEDRDEIVRMWQDMNEKLVNYAKKHNLSAINAESILQRLINNPPELSSLLGIRREGPTTRSRRPKSASNENQVEQNPVVPISRTILSVEYKEEDESDKDYEPSCEEDCVDDEDISNDGENEDLEADMRLIEQESLSGLVDNNDEDSRSQSVRMKAKGTTFGDLIHFPEEDPSDHDYQESESEESLQEELEELEEEAGEIEEIYRHNLDNPDYERFLRGLSNVENERDLSLLYPEDEEDSEFIPTDEMLREDRENEQIGHDCSIEITRREVEGLILDVLPLKNMVENMEEMNKKGPARKRAGDKAELQKKDQRMKIEETEEEQQQQ